MTTTAPLAQQIKVNLAGILAEVEGFQVPAEINGEAMMLTVSDMANGDKARGNCWRTSNAVYEEAELGSIDFTDIDIVGVESPGLTHYAVYVSNGEEKAVIDFTARQFHADAPYPFVAPLNHWHAYMQHVCGRDMELVIG